MIYAIINSRNWVLLLGAVLFSLVAVANAPEQRLMIPHIEGNVVAVKGEIALPAFCSDIGRKWPDAQLTHIHWGGEESILHLVVNGQTKKVTLFDAFYKHRWIKMTSEARSISIRPTGPGIKLKFIKPAGFMVGSMKEGYSIARATFLQSMPVFYTADINSPIELYMQYQQQWWRAIYEVQRASPGLLRKRMMEIVSKYFQKKGLQYTLKDPGHITLIDKGHNLKTVSDFHAFETTSVNELDRL